MTNSVLNILHSFNFFFGYPFSFFFKQSFHNCITIEESHLISPSDLIFNLILTPILSFYQLASFWKSVHSLAFDFSLIKISFEFRTITPSINSMTVPLAIFELPFIKCATNCKFFVSEAICSTLFKLAIILTAILILNKSVPFKLMIFPLRIISFVNFSTYSITIIQRIFDLSDVCCSVGYLKIAENIFLN